MESLLRYKVFDFLRGASYSPEPSSRVEGESS
jgi:hypothetical protein